MIKFCGILILLLLHLSCNLDKAVNNEEDDLTGMVLIEAAGTSFTMGQPDPDIGGKGWSEREQPAHTVRFTYSWYMDKTEVTQKVFSELMSRTYQEYKDPPWGPTYIPFIGTFNLPKGDNYPAYFVNWYDAVLYCNE